ncbi:uncharacterized protein CYBJADRAFT_43008 [Cyberlindnera jadinii NRRL Y-1542]|uniref:Uncharacterized protein n=1 Tax=Cyberlindnera jadinii (strain ATCC 18201 / CBS 1600 / BCRC 20928 / JCM 3617 / NBRC 0987 / NRRL Y-1542) TaxID=983966 RepID=A0A1E4S6V1_CYBJN|nr:hypothetical protein CYBJADRAFT_43008 [Cyberlindnera jadinii NRRL Y-1542]ODV75245.1 hypothetical protein CYBJADRAFT_43008 [Cyberlindnera jadinii NRRL Y-1542]
MFTNSIPRNLTKTCCGLYILLSSDIFDSSPFLSVFKWQYAITFVGWLSLVGCRWPYSNVCLQSCITLNKRKAGGHCTWTRSVYCPLQCILSYRLHIVVLPISSCVTPRAFEDSNACLINGFLGATSQWTFIHTETTQKSSLHRHSRAGIRLHL